MTTEFLLSGIQFKNACKNRFFYYLRRLQNPLFIIRHFEQSNQTEVSASRKLS